MQKKFNPNILMIWIAVSLIMLMVMKSMQVLTDPISVAQLKEIVESGRLVNNQIQLKDDEIITGKYLQSYPKSINKDAELKPEPKHPELTEVLDSPKPSPIKPLIKMNQPSDEPRNFVVSINPAYDRDVVMFLKDKNINITYNNTPEWSGKLLMFGIVFIVIFVIFSLFFKKMGGGGGAGGAFSFNKSKFQRIDPNDLKISLNDVAGIDDVKFEVEQIVDFLKSPIRYTNLGAKIPKGVLLSGPPGTGKTLLAKAIAKEANVPFLSGSGSGFVEMFVGVGASRVRDLFDEARKVAPCIIFIDELDAIGKKRGGFSSGGNDEREQTLNQLLVEMDGFSENSGIIVVAATNRPDVLDSAFTRPGRFDRKISVGLPNKEGRKAILEIHATKKRKMPLAQGINFDTIARGTPGFSGAELENLVNEAALEAAKMNCTVVDVSHFETARDKVLMGLEQKNLTFSKEEKYNTAIHECGHTVINVLYRNILDPIHKVTIIPRGRAAGVTQTLPLDDGSLNYSDDKCNKMIQMLMGGRIAEEIFFNEKKTTGASNDIEKATMIAKNMVYAWGMSSLGFINIDNNQSSYDPKYNFSESTRSEADSIVKSILDDNYAKARKLLIENKDKLKELADKLFEEETLDSETVYEMLDSLTKEV